MSTKLNVLRESIDQSTIRAAGEADRFAVGLTDDELITARPSAVGGRPRIDRYPLRTLSELNRFPSPGATRLDLFFKSTPPRTLAFTYDAHATPDFDRIVALLQTYIAGNRPLPQSAPVQPVGNTDGPESRSLLRAFGGAIVVFLLLPAALFYAVKLLIR